MKQLLEEKKLFAWLYWIWAVVIIVLSSWPNIPTQKVNIWDEPFRLDYLAHFGIFGIWGGFFVLWKAKVIRFKWQEFPWYVLGSTLFAVVDELHQLWIEGRTFNPLDMMYNLLGLWAAYYIGPYFLKWVYKN